MKKYKYTHTTYHKERTTSMNELARNNPRDVRISYDYDLKMYVLKVYNVVGTIVDAMFIPDIGQCVSDPQILRSRYL